jgi:TIR domain
MSKIYVSYTNSDASFAEKLINGLRMVGHDITVDGTKIVAGTNWRETLNEGLKTADVFIFLLSQASLKAPYPLMELGTARAFAESSGRMLILPIRIDDASIPIAIQDIQILFTDERSIDETIFQIENSISNFMGLRVAKEIKQKESSQAVQRDLASFVNKAISTQEVYQSRNRRSADCWYAIGFFSLFLGILITGYVATTSSQSQQIVSNWSSTVAFAIADIVIIGLLAACAKYAFSLGRAYMSESLKSADRIHAIEFGRFYLQAFGETATGSEVKDAFQHWNIDRNSTFASLDSSQIDPQIISLVAQVVASITGKREK